MTHSFRLLRIPEGYPAFICNAVRAANDRLRWQALMAGVRLKKTRRGRHARAEGKRRVTAHCSPSSPPAVSVPSHATPCHDGEANQECERECSTTAEYRALGSSAGGVKGVSPPASNLEVTRQSSDSAQSTSSLSREFGPYQVASASSRTLPWPRKLPAVLPHMSQGPFEGTLSFSEEEWDILQQEPIGAPVWILMGDPYYGPSSSGHICILNEGQATKVRPARQVCTAPLAPITTNRINFEAFERLPVPPSATMREWWSWLTGRKIREHLGPSVPELPESTSRKFADGEIRQMRQWGVFRKGVRAKLRHPVFKVPKEDMSRLIMDCRELNKRLPRPGDMGLPNMHELLDRLLSKKFIAQLDGKSYFYQFPLDEGAQCYFGANLVERRGVPIPHVLQVLPMGFSYAPGIAQHTSRLILDNVKVHEGEVAEAWVDNFLLGADSEERINAMVSGLKEVCAKVSVELKGDVMVGTNMTVLGLRVDTKKKEIMPSEKLLSSLEIVYKRWQEKNTPRIFFQLAGTALWCMYAVARTPLCFHEGILNHMRHLATGTRDDQARWDQEYVAPVSLREDITSLYEGAKTARWRQRNVAPETKGECWCDASLSGAGVVATRWSQWPQEHEEKWWGFAPITPNIYVNELMVAAASLLQQQRTNIFGPVWTDNMPAMKTILKGHSSSRAANIIMRKLCSERKAAIELGWVSTKIQRADALSRGEFAAPKYFGPFAQTKQARWGVGHEDPGENGGTQPD
jgi:hypothetical protein